MLINGDGERVSRLICQPLRLGCCFVKTMLTVLGPEVFGSLWRLHKFAFLTWLAMLDRLSTMDRVSNGVWEHIQFVCFARVL